jgi:hypothetical protein
LYQSVFSRTNALAYFEAALQRLPKQGWRQKVEQGKVVLSRKEREKNADVSYKDFGLIILQTRCKLVRFTMMEDSSFLCLAYNWEPAYRVV